MILSLEGCMAVGKTTALGAVAKLCPWLVACPEDISPALARLQGRPLDKTRYQDYLEIQQVWLECEVNRFAAALALGQNVLLDYGPAEIEFYTLHYPLSLGQSWQLEEPLAPQLAALRACRAQRILFLDATDTALAARRAADSTRSRAFFEHTLTRLLPLKRAWFAARPDTDFLDTTSLTPAATAQAVAAWCRAQQAL